MKMYFKDSYEYKRLMEIIDDYWLTEEDEERVEIVMRFKHSDGRKQMKSIEWVNPKHKKPMAMNGLKPISELFKYEWHDLRKNPHDLPEGKKAVVMAAYKCSLGRYGHWLEIVGCCDGVFDVDGDNVIAWRYIEPFEDEA